MGSRVPVAQQQYNLKRSSNSNSTSKSNSNSNCCCHGPGDIIVDRDDDDDSLDNDDHSTAVQCMHESYRSSLPLHGVGVEEDRSSLDNNGSSRDPYSILSIDDVLPIETARARFLDIIVDHFISSHVVEVPDSEADYMAQSTQDKLIKRKSRETKYEGDARFELPLMYVANMYETLGSEVNIRVSSLSGMHEKTISVALEAAGGLYRKLAKKFPRKGPCIFKRRELATSHETRSRFPELVIPEEKRVRFVVVNGLVIAEKPTNIDLDDAEWFKRLTGRTEAAISAQDYKFYAPRHKYRRAGSSSISSIPGLPAFSSSDNCSPLSTAQGYRTLTEQTPSKQHLQSLPHNGQFHPINQNHHQAMNQSQHAAHFSQRTPCGPPSHVPDITHAQQSSAITQHMACLQPNGHLGGRLHILPTSPAKFCDECGAPYLRETSKFCSECGVKRLGT